MSVYLCVCVYVCLCVSMCLWPHKLCVLKCDLPSGIYHALPFIGTRDAGGRGQSGMGGRNQGGDQMGDQEGGQLGGVPRRGGQSGIAQ